MQEEHQTKRGDNGGVGPFEPRVSRRPREPSGEKSLRQPGYDGDDSTNHLAHRMRNDSEESHDATQFGPEGIRLPVRRPRRAGLGSPYQGARRSKRVANGRRTPRSGFEPSGYPWSRALIPSPLPSPRNAEIMMPLVRVRPEGERRIHVQRWQRNSLLFPVSLGGLRQQSARLLARFRTFLIG